MRVMKERATSVKLMPEIEKKCMVDLGNLCLDKTKEKEVDSESFTLC